MIELGSWRHRLVVALIVIAIASVPLAAFVWYKIFREVDQPHWVTDNPETNFLYGSIGAESQAGVPYWIAVVLPRVFGDKLPGPGGYASLGLPWAEGEEFPAGFTKKTIGFDRVAFNCSLCHTAQYRVSDSAKPVIVAAGGSNTSNVQGLIDFFGNAAADPRFNADTLLTEIDLATRLSFVDRLLYKYVLIPRTKQALVDQMQGFAWSHTRPLWGPGRDAPINLTKFNLLHMPQDDSVDNTDFPAIWHLDARMQPKRQWPEQDYALTADLAKTGLDQSHLMLMNLAGDTTTVRSVIIDSALGLQAKNSTFFVQRMADIERWLRQLPAPKNPIRLSEADAALVSRGQSLFAAHCAECHDANQSNRIGTVIPLAEIGTDPERTNAWSKTAADGANKVVASMGIHRTPMSKPDRPGYIAVPLEGLWLRGPYLHNGSVPTLRTLLDPVACRPKTFYRGYDVLDPVDVGFVATGCSQPPPVASGCRVVTRPAQCVPEGRGWRYETSEKGNGNGGHDYGTTLPDADKLALIAYLKTR